MSKKTDKKASKPPPKVASLTKDNEGYSNFDGPDDTTNLILNVEQKKLFVHRDVMAVNCQSLTKEICQMFEDQRETKDPVEDEKDKLSAGLLDQVIDKAEELDDNISQKKSIADDISQKQLDNVSVKNSIDADAQLNNEEHPDEQEEKQPVEPLEMTLEDKQHSQILELLKIMYPPHKAVTEENVNYIAPLAGEYDIENIKTHCEKILMERESTVKLLLMAQECKLQNLTEKVAEDLAENKISDLKSQDGFNDLDANSQAEFYRRRIQYLEGNQQKLEESASLIYSLTKCIMPMHKCTSVDDNRYGYLVITTTDENGKKTRSQFNDSGLLNHREINNKCKECVINFGKDSLKELLELDKKGAFDHIKKKFESEKKGRGGKTGNKPGKK